MPILWSMAGVVCYSSPNQVWQLLANIDPKSEKYSCNISSGRLETTL